MYFPLMSVEPAFGDRGGGDVVVFVHGHPFDRAMWDPQLDDLSARFRCIALDLPGYGESRGSAGKISMSDLAGAVIGAADALGVSRFAVVGLSMGGLVAMELGLGWPERVSGLVLAATTAAPVTPEEVATRLRTAELLEREGMLPVALEMCGKLLGPDARRDPGLVTFVFSMMMRQPPDGAAAALRGRAERPDYASLLGELTVPTLVVAGEHDEYSPREVIDHLVASLPDPKVEWIAGAGHLPNLEAPERFNALVTDFVQSRRVGS